MVGPVQDKTNPGDPISSLNPDQVQNIKTIIGVGKSLGITQNGIVTALAVANDESTFLNYGSIYYPQSQADAQAMGQDHQSVGVFQQQVGYGWGIDGKDMMNVAAQAASFYGGNPNATAPGLLQQEGWQTADPGQMAQQVQQSGTPNAYYSMVAFGRKLYSAYNDTPAVTLPFTKPRAVGPLYVEHSVPQKRAATAAGTGMPPPQVFPEENSQGGLSKTPKAARVPAAPVTEAPPQQAAVKAAKGVAPLPAAPAATAKATGPGPDKFE